MKEFSINVYYAYKKNENSRWGFATINEKQIPSILVAENLEFNENWNNIIIESADKLLKEKHSCDFKYEIITYGSSAR